jgi:hypothetical protein
VEDAKGPARAGVRCPVVAPSRLLGRAVPGLAAVLVEVMLSDLPPSPATAAASGRFGIGLRRVQDVWRSKVSIGTGT